MRRTIMHYGPSVGRGGGPRIARMTVGVQKVRNTTGVIHRAGPGLQFSTTSKSKLIPKTVKGIRQPGLFTPNYAGPNY